MKCVIEVPKGKEVDFHWYMEQLDARILDEGDHLVYKTISEYEIQSALRTYKKEHPTIATYFKDTDLLETIRYDLQYAVDTSQTSLDLAESVSTSLASTLRDAELLKRIESDSSLSPEDVKKARRYLLEEDIHAWDASYLKESILSLLEKTEHIDRIIWRRNQVFYTLAHDLCPAIENAEKALFLANPKKPLDESLGNLLFNQNPGEDLTKAPATEEEQKKAKTVVSALRRFSEKMDAILTGLQDGSEKPFKANPLLQYLEAARELKPFLPERVALRTAFPLEEARTAREKVAYQEIQHSMAILDDLRDRRTDENRIVPALLTLDTPAQEAMHTAYSEDIDNLDYDSLTKRAATQLMDDDAPRSQFRELAELACCLGTGSPRGKEQEKAISRYTDELIQAARAQLELRCFKQRPGVTMHQIETARKYILEDGCLSGNAYADRDAVYRELWTLNKTQEALVMREWFTKTVPSCLNRMKEAEGRMEKDLFLAHPEWQGTFHEYTGAFLLTNDLHPFHAQAEKEQLMGDFRETYARLSAFCGAMDTIQEILRDAEPASSGTAYDPAFLSCMLVFQDAAKNLTASLKDNAIGLRQTFGDEELPENCQKAYREGEKALDILRGRLAPTGKESLAEKTMREIYTSSHNVFSYDELNIRTITHLRQMGASDKSVKEVAQIAGTIHPAIQNTRAYARKLVEQARIRDGLTRA